MLGLYDILKLYVKTCYILPLNYSQFSSLLKKKKVINHQLQKITNHIKTKLKRIGLVLNPLVPPLALILLIRAMLSKLWFTAHKKERGEDSLLGGR